jgi:hypothetical protein
LTKLGKNWQNAKKSQVLDLITCNITHNNLATKKILTQRSATNQSTENQQNTPTSSKFQHFRIQKNPSKIKIRGTDKKTLLPE